MKTIVKSILIAFSIYSKIPVPQFPWEEKEMKYMFCFFPFVGAVIGGGMWLWSLFCEAFAIGNICHGLVGTAIPLLITGGFHADGYMDTMDALHSYQSKEKKLEILKDPHIGAFSVLMLLLYYLIYLAAYSEITEGDALMVFCGGFFLSRVLGGISVLTFPPAKESGSLYFLTNGTEKKLVKGVLFAELLLCAAFLLWTSMKAGLLVLAASGICFGYYRYRSEKEFGGITGDLAGYFMMLCEGGIAVAAAVSCL